MKKNVSLFNSWALGIFSALPLQVIAGETVYLNNTYAYPVYENRRQLVSDVQYTTWLGYTEAERYTYTGFFAASDASKRRMPIGDEGRNLLQSYGSPISLDQRDFDEGVIVADLTSAYRLSTGETIERHWEQRLSAIITSATLNVDVESDIQLSPLTAEGCETELHLLDKHERVFDLTDRTKTVTLNGQSLPFPAGSYNIAIKTTCNSFDELPVYSPKVMVNGQKVIVKNSDAPIEYVDREVGDLTVEMSSLPSLHEGLVTMLDDGYKRLARSTNERNYRQTDINKAAEPISTGSHSISNGKLDLLDDLYEGELSDDLDKVLESRHFKIDFDASEPGVYEFLVKTKTNLTDLWNRKHPYVSIRNVTDQTHIINHGAKIGYFSEYQQYHFHPTDHMRDEVVVAHGSFNSDGTTKELLIDLITMPVSYEVIGEISNGTVHISDGYWPRGRWSLRPIAVYHDTHYPKDMVLLCSITSPCLVGDNVEIEDVIDRYSDEEEREQAKMYQYEDGTSTPPLFMQAEIYVKGPTDKDFVPLSASHVVGGEEVKREGASSWLDD